VPSAGSATSPTQRGLALAAQSRESRLGLHAGLQGRRLGGGDAGAKADPRELDQGDDGRAGSHEVPGVDLGGFDDSREGCLDVRVRELAPGRVPGHPREGRLVLGLFDLVLEIVATLLTDRVSFEELEPAFELALCVGHVGLAQTYRGHGLIELEAGSGSVEPEEGLALLHRVASLHQALDHAAGGLGGDRRLVEGVDETRHLVPRRELTNRDCRCSNVHARLELLGCHGRCCLRSSGALPPASRARPPTSRS
jgi:hypothetical protein